MTHLHIIALMCCSFVAGIMFYVAGIMFYVAGIMFNVYVIKTNISLY